MKILNTIEKQKPIPREIEMYYQGFFETDIELICQTCEKKICAISYEDWIEPEIDKNTEQIIAAHNRYHMLGKQLPLGL